MGRPVNPKPEELTIANKHAVIEVLLCCGDRGGEENGVGDTLSLRDDLRIFETASLGRQGVLSERDGMTLGDEDYEDDCLEAAYRLIESSETLRRGWVACAGNSRARREGSK